MEKFLALVENALQIGATDIHLVNGLHPLYRVKRTLTRDFNIDVMNKYDLEGLLESLVGDSLELVEQFEQGKKLDLPYRVNENVRLRINASMAAGVPTFAIRIIRNMQIDVERCRLGEILDRLKKYHSGLVLITGSVNSGKTTTLNAYVQELNKKENKKIVMLEEPIEYVHESNKCVIVQKEVNSATDVPSYYDGVINLLREDADIAIVGEIRDRQTMDAVVDLAEAGGLVIGTMHTRSCGETIERILSMYNPNEQKAIKYTLSNILKLIVSQKLVKSNKNEIIMVPEVLVSNSTISALIRQDSFSISEIKDAIHLGKERGMISFEKSFTKLLKSNIIDLECVRNNVETESYDLILNMMGGDS
ncbi:MAG: Flp pilus assembly complex ATPase component TadA [Clostridia bacterium]|nr:Flp pilus assembly complex ATPase component TadA [Clostridia bacterium]